jgi:hypothetical protein
MSPPRPYAPSPLFDDDVDSKVKKRRTGRIGQARTSLASWARVEPHRRPVYDRILAVVRGRGQAGATLSELAIALNLDKSSFSGRLSELIAAGELEVLRDPKGKEVERDGCRVLVAVARV